jgi:Protein of unknown function (DUF4238)
MERSTASVFMDKAVEKEQQHAIPAAYLKGWACPNAPPGKAGMVWVVQKHNVGSRELKSPRKYFRGKDRYTLDENGTRNLAVENAPGTIERDFSGVASRLKTLEPLTGHDRVTLAFFVAAMMLRTNHYADVVGNMLRKVQTQAAKLAAGEKIEPSLSDVIATLLPNLVGELVRTGITEYSRMIFQMRLSVFITDDEAGFVTGDEPCFVCVPGQWNAFLGHPDVELTVPLSPRHLAYYSWKVPPRVYTKWDRKKVDRLNSRTIAGCKREFVSWKGVVRDEWFVPDLPDWCGAALSQGEQSTNPAQTGPLPVCQGQIESSGS